MAMTAEIGQNGCAVAFSFSVEQGSAEKENARQRRKVLGSAGVCILEEHCTYRPPQLLFYTIVLNG